MAEGPLETEKERSDKHSWTGRGLKLRRKKRRSSPDTAQEENCRPDGATRVRFEKSKENWQAEEEKDKKEKGSLLKRKGEAEGEVVNTARGVSIRLPPEAESRRTPIDKGQ